MTFRGWIMTLVVGSLLWTMPLRAATVMAPALAAAPAAQAPATEDIHDVRGPVPIPLWWRWLALGGGAVLLAGLSAMTVVMVRRRRAKPLKPHERALLRLEQAQPLAVAGQVREYAGAASDAVRDYIEERFLLRAAHATTEEFFDDILAPTNAMLGVHRDSLLRFLGACDLAKFARLPLPREQMVSLNDLARQFVLDTAPSAAEEKPAPDLKHLAPRSGTKRGEVAERSEAGEGLPVSRLKDPGHRPGGGTARAS